MVRQWQDLFWRRTLFTSISPCAMPNFATLARRSMARSVSLYPTEVELESTALRQVLPAGRTAILDVHVDRSEPCYPMIAPGGAAVDIDRVPDEPRTVESRDDQHTLAVQLDDHPGALARVTQLFARRGYNIDSLAVGPSERPDVSRLTLRVDCSEHALEQIVKQMHKLVNVLRVTELAGRRGRRARARADHCRRAARAAERAGGRSAPYEQAP